MVREKYPHLTAISHHLAQPRYVGKGVDRDFSYQRAIVPGRCKSFPESLRYGWSVFFKGELVETFLTRKEAIAFIKEKME
jgi:hypothetical protein